MRIIGIAGSARAGKDTIAAWLVRNRRALTFSFATPIKSTLEKLFGIDPEVWRGPEKETALPLIGKSPRELAQTLGTEWGRNLVHPDVWVIAARRVFDSAFVLDGQIVAIPDVRFENEAAFVRERGTMIHVYRDGADGKVGIAGHESERGVQLESGDIMLSNNGTVDALHDKLAALFPPSTGAI